MDSWNRRRTTAHAVPVDGRWLDRVTVARPTGLAEDVNALLARLRAVTWEILDSEVSTTTLADLALAALAWHQLHGRGHAADAWRTVHTQLRSFSTLAPADREVRSHVGAFVSASRLTPDSPADDVRETSAAFADLATSSLGALQQLQATGQLWINADTLTGEDVSEDPELAAAKLRRGIVPARPEHLHGLTVAYRIAVLGATDHLLEIRSTRRG
jgi:hypothetical protein